MKDDQVMVAIMTIDYNTIILSAHDAIKKVDDSLRAVIIASNNDDALIAASTKCALAVLLSKKIGNQDPLPTIFPGCQTWADAARVIQLLLDVHIGLTCI